MHNERGAACVSRTRTFERRGEYTRAIARTGYDRHHDVPVCNVSGTSGSVKIRTGRV